MFFKYLGGMIFAMNNTSASKAPAILERGTVLLDNTERCLSFPTVFVQNKQRAAPIAVIATGS